MTDAEITTQSARQLLRYASRLYRQAAELAEMAVTARDQGRHEDCSDLLDQARSALQLADYTRSLL
ncbi:MAG: hypothetical protein HC814_03125 [Rhodobacteraceae bacterium]|nr:hypothetical protein [Paracoccaceae bacterium]